MTKNSARIDFNLSILEDSLDRDISNIMQELASRPDKLLVRCIKRAGGDTDVAFSKSDLKFMTTNFIAKTRIARWTDYGGDSDSEVVFDKFLPPWNGFFKQLGTRLNNATLNLQNP